MPGITKKTIARNVVITVTPLTETGGVFAEGTPFVFTGRAGRVSLVHRSTHEDISGNDTLMENNVKIKQGWTLSLEAIKHITGTELEDIYMGFDYVKVFVQTSRVGRTYYGGIEEGSWNVEPGKNLDNIRVIPVDIGTANPAFVAAV